VSVLRVSLCGWALRKCCCKDLSETGEDKDPGAYGTPAAGLCGRYLCSDISCFILVVVSDRFLCRTPSSAAASWDNHRGWGTCLAHANEELVQEAITWSEALLAQTRRGISWVTSRRFVTATRDSFRRYGQSASVRSELLGIAAEKSLTRIDMVEANSSSALSLSATWWNETSSNGTLRGGSHQVYVTSLYLAAYCAVFLLSMVGNVAVVIMVLKISKNGGTRACCFIFNLVMCDLLVGIFCVPFTLIQDLLTGKDWLYCNYHYIDCWYLGEPFRMILYPIDKANVAEILPDVRTMYRARCRS